ncbi:MAG: ATP-binding protein [Bacteroidota bacterium]
MASITHIPFFRSLRFKIGFGYVVLVLINTSVAVWTIMNFGRLTKSLDMLQGENYQDVIAVENMARAIESHHHAISSLLNRDILNGRIEYTKADEDFRESFKQAHKYHTIPEDSLIIENIGVTYEGFIMLMDSLKSLVTAKNFDGAKAFHYNNISPFLERLSDNCFWLVEENQKQMLQLNNQTKKIANESILAIISGSLLAIGLSIITMTQFTRRIIAPAEKLTETVHQIGRGRLDLKTEVQTTDEIGELSREFNKMTERLRMYEALNIQKILLEKQKSETIVGNISDAIIVCDAQAIVQLINPSAEKLLGIKNHDAVGKTIEEITTDERLTGIFRTPDKFSTSTHPFLQFVENEKKVYFRPQISFILSRHGRKDGIVLVLQDVTQYRELDKAKSDFMATISHEFRTPLTSINIGVDILRQQMLGPLTIPQHELLESFKQDCDRLTKLVRELLQLSKLESRELIRREEQVDLKRVIESTIKPMQLQFQEKGVELIMKIDPKLPMLFSDEQHLSWVISNLVNNALRHTLGGGKVEVAACSDNRSILLTVADTGEGIPAEYLDKIFDKFVQVKRTLDATPGSVGLGLSIAKDIVEMYGGKIWVVSELQKGSTFSVRLPLGQEGSL